MTVLSDVDAIAGAIVNTQLAYTVANRLDVAGVSVSQTIQPSNNQTAHTLIPETPPPFKKGLGLFQLDHAI